MATQRHHIAARIALLLVLLASTVPLGASSMASTGDVLFNGGFEQGFVAVDGCGMVGKAWGCFNNGGTAAYGFYDDMWDPVVYQGEHSQLIEINTKQMGGDGDRNAGIFQTVWVKPHGEYELALKGMIRADDGGGDPWRYRVYVGFDYHGGQDWQAVEDWRELAWDTYYPRTEPGEMQSYSARFEAPSAMTTIWLMAIKKWATLERELDVNLDNVQLRACQPAKAMWPMHDGAMMPMGPERPMGPMQPMRPEQPMTCTAYIVRAGDTLGEIAKAYGSSVAAIARASRVEDPNWIYVGQELCIPTGASGDSNEPSGMPQTQSGPMPAPTPPASQPTMADQVPGTATDGAYGLYRVQRGDTLSSVAVRYDTSVEELMRLNGLSGSHWLYVGQQLRVPMR